MVGSPSSPWGGGAWGGRASPPVPIPIPVPWGSGRLAGSGGTSRPGAGAALCWAPDRAGESTGHSPAPCPGAHSSPLLSLCPQSLQEPAARPLWPQGARPGPEDAACPSPARREPPGDPPELRPPLSSGEGPALEQQLGDFSLKHIWREGGRGAFIRGKGGREHNTNKTQKNPKRIKFKGDKLEKIRKTTKQIKTKKPKT